LLHRAVGDDAEVEVYAFHEESLPGPILRDGGVWRLAAPELTAADLLVVVAEAPSNLAMYLLGAVAVSRTPLVVLSAEDASGLGSFGTHTVRYHLRELDGEPLRRRLADVIGTATADAEDRHPRRARPRVFVSYSHGDTEVLQRLKVHIAPLERTADVDFWSDERIAPGADWRAEIRAAIECCNYVLLLVSARFLASEFIATNELPPILEQAEQRAVPVVSLIVGHCRFVRTPELARYQAINRPEEPYDSMDGNRRDQVLDQLVAQMEQALGSHLTAGRPGS
jgi:hypothetical protein